MPCFTFLFNSEFPGGRSVQGRRKRSIASPVLDTASRSLLSFTLFIQQPFGSELATRRSLVSFSLSIRFTLYQ